MGFLLMEEQQAACCVGDLQEAQQAGECVAILFLLLFGLKFRVWRSNRPLPALANCAKQGKPGKALPFWAFCCLAEVPVMQQKQAVSSAAELREAEQAGERVAIWGFLLLR